MIRPCSMLTLALGTREASGLISVPPRSTSVAEGAEQAGAPRRERAREMRTAQRAFIALLWAFDLIDCPPVRLPTSRTLSPSGPPGYRPPPAARARPRH